MPRATPPWAPTSSMIGATNSLSRWSSTWRQPETAERPHGPTGPVVHAQEPQSRHHPWTPADHEVAVPRHLARRGFPGQRLRSRIHCRCACPASDTSAERLPSSPSARRGALCSAPNCAVLPSASRSRSRVPAVLGVLGNHQAPASADRRPRTNQAAAQCRRDRERRRSRGRPHSARQASRSTLEIRRRGRVEVEVGSCLR